MHFQLAALALLGFGRLNGVLAAPTPQREFNPAYVSNSNANSTSTPSSNRAVSSPSAKPSISSNSFRSEVRHRLHDHAHASAPGSTANLTQRASNIDGVTFGAYWFTQASAGGQAVDVLLDTGSADLWLLSPNLPSSSISAQSLYSPHASGSSSTLPLSFSISYGTGGNGVSGPMFADDFSLAGVTVPKMPIGSATKLAGISPGTFKSGIVGLAFQSGNSVRPVQQATFMELLQEQEHLDEPVFVCNFKKAGGGFVEFGKVDDALFHGPLSTIRADNSSSSKYPGSWSSEGVTYVSNGEILGRFDIVFDTGGPGTSGPIDIVRKYYARVPGARDVSGDGSQWDVPCSTTMPDLQFAFSNGATGTIPGSKMLSHNGNRCSGALVKENSPTRGLVGDAFFDSNVVVFNQRDATISWAPQV